MTPRPTKIPAKGTLMNWTIRGGRSLMASQLALRNIHVKDGLIAAAPSRDARVIEAHDLLVLPGIVDIHGDGFERQLMPRPGVRFATALALRGKVGSAPCREVGCQ